MASTTAFFTGLTGLSANSRNLDVIGNNIANVNTTAFKSSRMLFATQFSRTFSAGTAPSANTGGTNPTQIGLGTTIAGTQRSFTAGNVSPTGDARDLAIDGNGFFIVKRGNEQFYTRAGSFRQNTTNDLVSIGGERVQGYGVDSSFNLVTGALTDINIPVGTLTIAEATKSVRLAGNLNAGGAVPTRGSLTTFSAISLLATANPPPGPGEVANTSSRLVDIADSANPTAAQFQAGQSIELRGAKKGTKDVPASKFTVTTTSTVQDLLNFFSTSLGINTSIGNNPDGRTPGASINPATGVISITGNTGTANNIEVETADLQILSPSGTVVGRPLTATQTATSDGESVRTTLVAYDSLGNEVTTDVTFVLESKSNGAGTTWRYYAESPDSKGLTPIVGAGTASFDASGRLSSSSNLPVSVDRTGTGAKSPLDFNLVLSDLSNTVTALSTQNSNLAAVFQDGAAIGTLQAYSVGQDGVITGGFSNGLTRTLGQVAIATFSNPEGLVETGGNLFRSAPNSGNPIIGRPLELGAGKVVGGALELSNVDLSQEFINLILTSTGYSASSRVITTTDQLVQQLLAIGR